MSLRPSAIRLQRTALLVATLFAAPLAAQVSPYASEAPRGLPALSDQEVADLLAGAGMGFARAAELNGVPGPRHAIDMADPLELDAAQRARLDDVFARMNARARELGADIVARERALDALFAGGGATADEIERQTREIALREGALRATHLIAHLETNRILTPHQVARYAQMRGYASADHQGAAADHGAHH